MKLIGTYTARGIVSEDDTTAGNPQKIPLFDGSFKTGYRIVEFKICGTNVGGSTTADCVGKLSKNDDGAVGSSNFWRFDDDNQIAWAKTDSAGDGGGSTGFDSIIDPDNLVVEDLYVYIRGAGSGVGDFNYIVTMEKYEIDDWQGALAMARDRAQGDL